MIKNVRSESGSSFGVRNRLSLNAVTSCRRARDITDIIAARRIKEKISTFIIGKSNFNLEGPVGGADLWITLF